MNSKFSGDKWRRHSLLFRNPSLNQQEFSKHYETHHGPLAASLEGFRKYCWRYIQNHVLPLPDGAEPRFHGISMTSQVPRKNYRVGFFNEPDYEAVKSDEKFLFDINRTVSILAREGSIEGTAESPWKAIVIAPPEFIEQWKAKGITRRILNHLDQESASALGFNSSEFSHELLVELWFTSESDRDAAYYHTRDYEGDGAKPFFLPVREVVIYGPEKPWSPKTFLELGISSPSFFFFI